MPRLRNSGGLFWISLNADWCQIWKSIYPVLSKNGADRYIFQDYPVGNAVQNRSPLLAPNQESIAHRNITGIEKTSTAGLGPNPIASQLLVKMKHVDFFEVILVTVRSSASVWTTTGRFHQHVAISRNCWCWNERVEISEAVALITAVRRQQLCHGWFSELENRLDTDNRQWLQPIM